MSSFDTTMGGSQGAFPETAWSTMISAGTDEAARRATINRLCTTYWRPVYSFIRAAWKRPVEEAKDLTQEFFRHLLEVDIVARYRPQAGRFRHFLKAALRNFLSEAHRDATRQKRGGGQVVVSLDVTEVETDRFLSDLREKTPDELFDRQWYQSVMRLSMMELRRSLAEENRLQVFEVFEAYDMGPGHEEAPSYESLGRRFNLPVTQITHHLHEARGRLREIILRNVRDAVSSNEELADEMRDLFEGMK